MELLLIDNLPFINITIGYNKSSIDIPNVLVDTGSASSIFSSDIVEPIGIVPQENDVPYIISGVGGSEVVYRRRIEYLKVAEFILSDFEIEVGGMDYGFDIYGILGMDFLQKAKAIIHLAEMKIYFKG